MIRKSLCAAIGLLLLLPACQTNQTGTDEGTGTLSTAPTDGSVRSQFTKGTGQSLPTISRDARNGGAGHDMGASPDKTDRARIAIATNRAMLAPVGQQITWHNPQTGNSGTIVPSHDGYNQTGDFCREFQQTTTVGGQQQQSHGKACQQPDGSWKIVQ